MSSETFSEQRARTTPSEGRALLAGAGLFAAGFFLTVLMGLVVFFVRAKDLFGTFAFGIPFGVLAVVLLWKRARSAPPRLRFGATLLGFFGATMAVGAGLMLVDKLGDTSPAVAHTVKVVGKNRGKNGHFFSLESWLEPGVAFDVHTPVERWNAVNVGDTIEIQTHAGLLGVAWVEALR